MALFTNYATLSYNGVTTTSNVVTGEILDPITAGKTAVVPEYTASEDVTFLITLTNSGAEAVTGLTVTDDLGGYAFEGETVYPLAYVENSLRYFVDGVLQNAPAVVSGPPLVVSDISVPADGNVVLVYEATVTAYAPLAADTSITNTVEITGAGLSAPVTASATITAENNADLRIRKALFPTVVAANGELTYTFTMENTGNTAAVDGVVLEDTFDPRLGAVNVSFNGTPWTVGVNYTYDEATGVFATMPGQIGVPAANFAQNADGSWTVTPGSAVLTVTGTVMTNT